MFLTNFSQFNPSYFQRKYFINFKLPPITLATAHKFFLLFLNKFK
jgi:hypothetical protein